jgi:hypothetical protein
MSKVTPSSGTMVEQIARKVSAIASTSLVPQPRRSKSRVGRNGSSSQGDEEQGTFQDEAVPTDRDTETVKESFERIAGQKNLIVSLIRSCARKEPGPHGCVRTSCDRLDIRAHDRPRARLLEAKLKVPSLPTIANRAIIKPTEGPCQLAISI